MLILRFSPHITYLAFYLQKLINMERPPFSPGFGNPEKRMEELSETLQERGLKIGLVENSTGGFLSSLLVRRKGASRIFAGSLIPYSYEMKEAFGLKAQKGAVSEEFTNLSAEKFLEISGADIVVSESSILGPEGGSPEKPVGLSFVSIASKRGKTSFVNLFRGNRLRKIREVSAFCFLTARLHILGWDMKTRPVASTFIEHEGKILIMKRSKKVGTYRGMWGVASGHIEEGETPVQTALKEVREETSIGSEMIKELIQGTPFEVVDPKLGIRWLIHPFRAILNISPRRLIRIDWEHTEFRMIKPSRILSFRTSPMLYEGYLKTVFRF